MFNLYNCHGSISAMTLSKKRIAKLAISCGNMLKDENNYMTSGALFLCL